MYNKTTSNTNDNKLQIAIVKWAICNLILALLKQTINEVFILFYEHKQVKFQEKFFIS